ncbi:MAG: hypothetical protein R3E66_11725 [bacterium]
MKTHRLLVALASVIFWSSVASAQTIRSYGDQAEATYGTQAQINYPGAPVPQKSAAPAADPAATPTADGEKKDEPVYSGVTQMYGGSPANNQPLPTDLTPEQMYRGVIPGTRDSVKHLEKAAIKGQSGANELLWIGFQPRDQSTRVFVQTAREANYDMTTEGNAVVLTFANTKLSARNFSRFIDTSFFNRNVTRIESKKKGKDVVVTISLKNSERPQVNTTDKYVYIEFGAETVKSDDTSDKKSDDTPRALDE